MAPMRAFALLTALAATPAIAASVPLAAFKDHNPVVLMFAASPEDRRLARQTDEIAKLEAAAFYQSVIVVGVTGDIVMGTSDTARSLRGRFGVPAGAFRVVLLDRDGRAAFAQSQVSPVGEIKAAVDAGVKRIDPTAQPPSILPPQSPARTPAGVNRE